MMDDLNRLLVLHEHECEQLEKQIDAMEEVIDTLHEKGMVEERALRAECARLRDGWNSQIELTDALNQKLHDRDATIAEQARRIEWLTERCRWNGIEYARIATLEQALAFARVALSGEPAPAVVNGESGSIGFVSPEAAIARLDTALAGGEE